MNANGDVKISFNDMVVKAVAMALRKHPNVNSSWLGDVIRRNQHVHIGVAVAVEDGLLCPSCPFRGLKRIGSNWKRSQRIGRQSKIQEITTSRMGRKYLHNFKPGNVRNRQASQRLLTHLMLVFLQLVEFNKSLL